MEKNTLKKADGEGFNPWFVFDPLNILCKHIYDLPDACCTGMFILLFGWGGRGGGGGVEG